MIKVLKITQDNVALVLEGHFVAHRDGIVPAIAGKVISCDGRITDIQAITNAVVEDDTGEVLHEAWQAGTLNSTDQGLEVRFEGSRMTRA